MIPDAGDAVGNRHTRQAGRRKRPILDAGDGIAVVGGGNDNVTGSTGAARNISSAAGNRVIDLGRCQHRPDTGKEKRENQNCCFHGFAWERPDLPRSRDR